MIKKIKKKITLSVRLGASLFDSFKLLLLALFFKANNKFGLIKNFGGRAVKLKLGDKNFVFYPTDNSDLAILEEIFIKDEYNYDLPNVPDVILDLGSNVGLATVYFKLRYPEAKIYSFEPDPITFRKLKKNTAQFDNIFCFNEAIAGRSGKMKFYVYPGSSMSSSLISRIDSQPFVEVDCRSLDDFMDQEKIFNVDLIKFDVEGSEMEIFKDFKRREMISCYIGEVHLDLMGVALESFLSLFHDYKSEVKEISKGRRYSVCLTK